jgi:hypothetical protein
MAYIKILSLQSRCIGFESYDPSIYIPFNVRKPELRARPGGPWTDILRNITHRDTSIESLEGCPLYNGDGVG